MKITAVIVTYLPSLLHLEKMISILLTQVNNVFIIDNSDFELDESIIKMSRVNYIHLKGNMGIAYAQNIGILNSYNGSDFIITFDQDSNPPLNLIGTLVNEYFRLERCGFKVACIGPTVVNERDGTIYKKYFKGSNLLADDAYNVYSLISSGTLYPVESFANVGINKADWFIDSIDIEWCYRARSLGYNVVMTKKVSMMHNLGAGDKALIAGKKINYGAPIRLYYVYRNWVFSLKERCFPLRYKLRVIMMIPLKFLIFSTIPPRRSRIKNMLLGLKDGILNRSGKL